MRHLILLSIVFILMVSGCLKKDKRQSEEKSTQEVPEETEEPKEKEQKRDEKPLEIDPVAFDKTLDANLRAFDQIPYREDNGWNLSNIVLFLGLTTGGKIGTLFGGGRANSQIFFNRKKTTASIKTPSEPTITINTNSTPAQISDQIETIVQGIMASGKVTDEEVLRKTLLDQTMLAQKNLNQLKPLTTRSWRIAMFRLFMSISASGKLSTDFGLGNTVNTILIWTPISGKHPWKETQNGKQLNQLVGNLSDSLSAVPDAQTRVKDFKLNRVGVGLGGFVSGPIGPAVVTGFSMGMLFFERTSKPAFSGKFSGIIPILDQNPQSGDLVKAKEQGVTFEVLEGSVEDPQIVVYNVEQKYFAQQLSRASLHAHSITGRVANKEGTHWEPTGVWLNFSVSLSGQISPVTLGGQTGVEFQFNK